MNDLLLAVLYVFLCWLGMAVVGVGVYLLLLPGEGLPPLLSILSRAFSSLCIVLWGVVIVRFAFSKMAERAGSSGEL
jgi:hypothetical protein